MNADILQAFMPGILADSVWRFQELEAKESVL